MPDPVVRLALEAATGALAAKEERPSQVAMAEAVAAAVRERRHLIVQAGTGTGKSLAYLVPTLALGVRTVVSTATKALQDQLAERDLPMLSKSLGLPFEFAVLKGRSNYACLQRVAEIGAGGEQLDVDVGPLGRQVRRLAAWAQDGTGTGDRAELPFEPSDTAWAAVSTSARDCPGAHRCPSGGMCFAEKARERAAMADVVVVNSHLYATSLASGGAVLPPHDVVVFDEAHELEDITSAAFGFELTAGRFAALARSARPLLDDAAPAAAVEDAGSVFSSMVAPWLGRAVPVPLPADASERLAMISERLSALQAAVRKSGRDADDDMSARCTRALQALGHLGDNVAYLTATRERDVVWVEGTEQAPLLRVAPLDVGEVLRERLWSDDSGPTSVLTSATIPPRMSERLGLLPGSFDQLDVGSPYAYDEQALLYCPLHLPDPRRPEYEPAMHEELASLIEAAGGRTLALFTSWRAMHAAAEYVKTRVPFVVLTQADLPKPALVARFSSDEQSCLFATMGFWQGVDVPGRACTLVTIDKLPFSRPDDPLLEARRKRLGPRAFEMIDVPRTAALLAQGTGRLIRTSTDRGVVAVLDRRLGKARYRWDLIRALPPMRRTKDRAEVTTFLQQLSNPAAPEPSVGSASPGRP